MLKSFKITEKRLENGLWIALAPISLFQYLNTKLSWYYRHVIGNIKSICLQTDGFYVRKLTVIPNQGNRHVPKLRYYLNYDDVDISDKYNLVLNLSDMKYILAVSAKHLYNFRYDTKTGDISYFYDTIGKNRSVKVGMLLDNSNFKSIDDNFQAIMEDDNIEITIPADKPEEDGHEIRDKIVEVAVGLVLCKIAEVSAPTIERIVDNGADIIIEYAPKVVDFVVDTALEMV